ncbi:MAG: hypothetical protein WBG46_07615 [Nonlabens sp.]
MYYRRTYDSINYNGKYYYLPFDSILWEPPLDDSLLSSVVVKSFKKFIHYFRYDHDVFMDYENNIKVAIHKLQVGSLRIPPNILTPQEDMSINGKPPIRISEDYREYFYKDVILDSSYTGYLILRADPTKNVSDTTVYFYNESKDLQNFETLIIARFYEGELLESLTVCGSPLENFTNQKLVENEIAAKEILTEHVRRSNVGLELEADPSYKKLDFPSLCSELMEV